MNDAEQRTSPWPTNAERRAAWRGCSPLRPRQSETACWSFGTQQRRSWNSWPVPHQPHPRVQAVAAAQDGSQVQQIVQEKGSCLVFIRHCLPDPAGCCAASYFHSAVNTDPARSRSSSQIPASSKRGAAPITTDDASACPASPRLASLRYSGDQLPGEVHQIPARRQHAGTCGGLSTPAGGGLLLCRGAFVRRKSAVLRGSSSSIRGASIGDFVYHTRWEGKRKGARQKIPSRNWSIISPVRLMCE